MEDTTETSQPAADAGSRLQQDCQRLFPRYMKSIAVNSATEWQTIAEHGVTITWVVQMSAPASAPRDAAFQVRKVLRLGFAVPVNIIDELITHGWTVTELADLMSWVEFTVGTTTFPETVRRLRELHGAAPGIGGGGRRTLWHALAALMSAGPAGLTDLQALRWFQVLAQKTFDGVSQVDIAMILSEKDQQNIQEWSVVTGPEGWVWPAAGYTLDEARLLLALPETHPDRPGPDQLAVMAALQQP